MYNISLDDPKDREFRGVSEKAKFKYNYPLIAVLAINTCIYLYTLAVPTAMMELALYPQVVDWGVVTFNFTHASFIHVLFNMLGCFLFARDIQTYFLHRPMYQWFVYFGFAPFIGLVVAAISSTPVVGYSGVLTALIGLAVALNFKGSRFVLLEIIIFHAIILLFPNKISIATHVVGFIIGYGFGLLALKYGPNKKTAIRNWRDRLGNM